MEIRLPGEGGGGGSSRQAARRTSQLSLMSDDAEIRRRRVAFRARHRGTKEMDWLIGRFADARLATMQPDELDGFERLLELPEPVIHDMIIYPEIAPAGEFAELIAQLRTFHGLE